MSHPSRTAEVQTPSVLSDRALRVAGELAKATDTDHSGKRMLADVLWDAANTCLKSCDGDYPGRASIYTCDAVNFAGGGHRHDGPAVKFLQSLGLPRGADDMYDLFNAFEQGASRQGVRYMWLLLAMHVAEDEGIAL